MEAIPWLITCVCVYLLARQRAKPKALPSTPVQQMLDEPKPKHRLARIWQTIPLGHTVWNWRCHCAAYGNNYVSEASALEAYKIHEDLHTDTETNYYRNLYEQTLQEFAEFKDNCYCKDIH